ncbi:MAG: anti-sigma factor [Bacteroidetes bacterium]|nr:anti-sigma factor [Bacteroidota bacterium]
MDLKEYISSGIIESYALGILGDQERREVECLSKIYPELAQELFSAQEAIERLSGEWKKTPPAALKQSVMEAISKEARAESASAKKVTKVISLNNSVKSNNFVKYAAAASFVGLAVIGGLYISSRNQINTQQEQLVAQEQTTQKLSNEVQELQASLEVFDTQKEILLDKGTKMVALTGTDISPESDMKMFWNPEKKKVGMYNTRLPKPASDLQYQLWAIVDGKPVDLGVFDVLNEKELVTKDLDLKNIQAFAVTLEKKGGSPSPNLEQLYVIGNV